jgi:hypothetical protein
MRTTIVYGLLCLVASGQEFPPGVYPGQSAASVMADDGIACRVSGPPGLGSGANLKVGSRKFVLTCWHCVSRNRIQADIVEIECGDETVKGQFVQAYDVDGDIALLSVPWTKDHPAAELGDAEPPIGDEIVTVGLDRNGEITSEVFRLHEYRGTNGHPSRTILVKPAFISGQSGSGMRDRHGRIVGLVVGNDLTTRPWRGRSPDLALIRRVVGRVAQLERASGALRKKRVIVAGAKWCAPCNKWHASYDQGNDEIEVVPVDIDGPKPEGMSDDEWSMVQNAVKGNLGDNETGIPLAIWKSQNGKSWRKTVGGMDLKTLAETIQMTEPK